MRKLPERRVYSQPKVMRCGNLQRPAATVGHPARDGDCEKIRAGIPAAARRVTHDDFMLHLQHRRSQDSSELEIS